MNILLTGGSGVIGSGLIPALTEAGHKVRLLTRHADRDADRWPDVEPFAADITDPDSLQGAADSQDAILHLAGIERESDRQTFQRVNVDGTRNLVREAERAGAPRFLYVSSLGADKGSSEYQQSKRAAERIVEGYPGAWTILRPGLVYGPGDQVMTSLLMVVRSFPAIPVPGAGDERIQPLWYQDLATGLRRALERDDLDGRALDLAGGEVVTVRELLHTLRGLEDRAPPEVPIPSFLAKLGMQAARDLHLLDLLERITGLDLPIDPGQLQMLEEENFIQDPADNALIQVLGVDPLPLQEGLRRLTVELPEHLPDDGVGPMERSRFQGRIRDSALSAEALMDVFRREASDLLPVSFVHDQGDGTIQAGDALELHLPGRGNVAVRVEEAGPRTVTLATLVGHPLTGFVRFMAEPEGDRAEPEGDQLQFTIEVHARAAGIYDFALMNAGGHLLQRATWRDAVHRVADRTGGTLVDGVNEDHTHLDDDQAAEATQWIRDLVHQRESAKQTG